MSHRDAEHPGPAQASHAHSHGEFTRPRRYDRSISLLTFGRIGRARSHTIRLASLRPGESVLDAGAGTGDLAILASKAVRASGRVIGIDASPEMVQAAQTKAAQAGRAIVFAVGRMQDLELADGSMDCVLTSYVLHHVPEPAQTEALREFFRVLKPGGRLLIVEIEPATSLWRRIVPSRHAGPSALDAYGARLAASGFQCIEPIPMPFRGQSALRAAKPLGHRGRLHRK